MKTGGRTKGTANKRSSLVAEKIARMGCDPFEGMARIALNDLPCGVCRGSGRTRYALPAGNHADSCEGNRRGAKCTCDGISERTCQSCYGTLYEAVAPELRGKMCTELAKYCAPQLKAIEHTGEGGGDIGVRLVVEFK